MTLIESVLEELFKVIMKNAPLNLREISFFQQLLACHERDLRLSSSCGSKEDKNGIKFSAVAYCDKLDGST